MLQFLNGVTFVMTTNLSFSDLDAIDAEHCGGALLRKGRITDRITMQQQPFGKSLPQPFGKSLTKRNGENKRRTVH
jgi:hypothetical protein